MASWLIEDYDEIFILVNSFHMVPKFRATGFVVEEPILYWYWTNTEWGDGGLRRMFKIDYRDVITAYGYGSDITTPTSAQDLRDQIEALIRSAFDGGGGGHIPLTVKGDILTSDGVTEVVHSAGLDRSLLGYWSANSDGLRNWTPAEVLTAAGGITQNIAWALIDSQ